MQVMRIRVAVIDDHRVFAEALASRLADEPDLEVVGTAATSAEAMELFSSSEIDVVTLDLDLAGEDGLALGRALREQWPAVEIVVVTAAADDFQVAEAVQMGVRGWVTKQSPVESLLSDLRSAARGETHLPAALLTRVMVSLSERIRSAAPEADALSILTARELDVLRCLTEGLSRNQIGTLLHVSPNTVRTHIQSILHKLGVHSALAATAFARRVGVNGLRDGEVVAMVEASPLDPGGVSPSEISS
ncbi:MAG: response regulator transcription factor [Actinomycetota bacterium]